MQFIASKLGNELVIPVEFRDQFVRRGFRLREAPADLPTVSAPTGLEALSSQVIQPPSVAAPSVTDGGASKEVRRDVRRRAR